MKGALLTIVKGSVTYGVETGFGPNWPGQRCFAKTRKCTACQRPAYEHNRRCGLHGGLSTGARTPEGFKRISEANLKHDRMTKDKLDEQRRLAYEGRILKARLKRIENLLIDAGLMPDDG